MVKARCAQCREYFPKETFYRTGIGGVHSEECFRLKQQKKRTTKEPTKKAGIRKAKEAAKIRDAWSCRLCSSRELVQAHHVRYLSEGGPNDVRNLISLCERDHSKVHSNKAVWQPVLLVWLYAYYVFDEELTYREAQRIVDYDPDTTGKARAWSDVSVMSSRHSV